MWTTVHIIFFCIAFKLYRLYFFTHTDAVQFMRVVARNAFCIIAFKLYCLYFLHTNAVQFTWAINCLQVVLHIFFIHTHTQFNCAHNILCVVFELHRPFITHNDPVQFNVGNYAHKIFAALPSELYRLFFFLHTHRGGEIYAGNCT